MPRPAKKAKQSNKGSSGGGFRAIPTTKRVHDTKPTTVRLPVDVKPKHYALKIEVDLENSRFSGKEIVGLAIEKETDVLEFHAVDLDITEVLVIQESETFIPTSCVVDDYCQTVTYQFAKKIAPGHANLELKFAGVLTDKLAGFYRSKYVHEGVTHKLAVTQFEATDARRAFPCWDEPAFKAVFNITLVIPSKYQAISNTPVRHLNVTGNKATYVFESTPIMSTYLVAFIVGEYEEINTTSDDGVLIKVFTPLGKKHLGNFALNVASKCLTFYSKLFQIPYPLQKMDLVTVPDFAAGAMENWGCITYRELALLIDDEQSSTELKRRVARTVCHEIAHQWFGNLVTMEWWTHLWLNEGFARFLEFIAVDNIFPEWNIWSEFVSNIYSVAMRHDSMKNSHPIEVPVNHPDEVNEIFDIISYAKGASIIRMLHDYLSGDVFFKGLKIYLEKHKYGNATTGDLWNAMSDASDKDVSNLMHVWTSQMGFPVITLSDNGRGEFAVSIDSIHETPAMWVVPLSILCSSGETVTLLLKKGNEEPVGKKLTELSKSNSWIKLNRNQSGFFRVNYTIEMWTKLAEVVPNLPAIDKLGLVTDAFALAKSGALLISEALNLLLKYKEVEDMNVFSEIIQNLENLYRLFGDQPCGVLLKRFIIEMLEPINSKLLHQPEKFNESILTAFRAMVFGTLCLVGHKASVDEAKSLFYSHYVHITAESYGESLLIPDMRTPVYCAAVHAGDAEEWTMAKKLYRSSNISEEQRRCLQAMGRTQNVELLKKGLEFTLTPEVRSQDMAYMFTSVYVTEKGLNAAWDFFVSHWDYFDENFNKGGQSFILSGVVSNICAAFKCVEKGAEIQKFFEEHPAPSVERSVKQAVENITISVSRLQRDVEPLTQWLKKYYNQWS